MWDAKFFSGVASLCFGLTETLLYEAKTSRRSHLKI